MRRVIPIHAHSECTLAGADVNPCVQAGSVDDLAREGAAQAGSKAAHSVAVYGQGLILIGLSFVINIVTVVI